MATLFDNDKYQRLRGIANSVFSHYKSSLPQEVQEDVINDTVVKLEELYTTLTDFRGPFVWKIVDNAVKDWLRGRGFQSLPENLEDDEDDADGLPGPTRPRPRARSSRGDPPLCVMEARLELLYAQDHSEAFALLAHACWNALGWQPAQIVEALGDLTLGQAAQSFLKRYREETRIPELRLSSALKDLYLIPDSPEAAVQFTAYWQVPGELEKWVHAPDIAHEAANRRLAYLLHRELGLSYADIIVRGGDELEQIAAWFENEYARRHDLPLDEVRGRFGTMLDCGKVGKRRLNEYYSPARTITHWCNDVEKKLETRLGWQHNRGLEKILQAAPWPHKSLVFVENFILNTGYDEIARQYCHFTMGEVADVLAGRYANGRKKQEKAIRGALKQLRDQARGVAARHWSELVEHDKRVGEETGDVISRWRSDVLKAVRQLFGCHDKDTVLFAWDVGFMDAVNECKRRYPKGGRA